ELDELTAAPRWEMKIPGAEKAGLRARDLRSCRSAAPRRRLPRRARRDLVKDADEAVDVVDDGGGDRLMPRHDGKFLRHRGHAGGLERRKERCFHGSVPRGQACSGTAGAPPGCAAPYARTYSCAMARSAAP